MSDHHYTYSSDYIRTIAGCNAESFKLSHFEASLIRQAIAEAIGMTDEDLAEQLSLYYQDWL
jgi:hypothetical protein